MPTRGTLLSLRFGSVYLASVAAVVAAHFIAYPLYAYDSAGESTETAAELWLTIDIFMATGLFIMLMTTWMRKKATDAQVRAGSTAAGGGGNADCCPAPTAFWASTGGAGANGGDYCTDVRRWIGGNLMFYGAVLLTLAFIPNWFAAQWGPHSDGTIWHLIDTVLPVMFAVEARRIWCMTARCKAAE